MYLLLALLFVVSLAQTDYYLSSSTAETTLRAVPGRPFWLNIFVPEQAFPDPDAIQGMIWKDKGVFLEGEEFYYDRIHSNIEAFRVDGGVEFVGKWWAPPRESRQVLELIIYDANGPIIVDGHYQLVQRLVWVTCSNGIFCDGMERWVDGVCRSYSRARGNACSDNDPCTIDSCTEEDGGRCVWTLDVTVPGCAEKTCEETNCVSQCDGRVCGDDGCHGSCGGCDDGFVCSTHGTCVDVDSPQLTCDAINPVCATDCGRYAYCGTNCACVAVSADLPDLTVAISDIALSNQDISSNCTFVEGCSTAIGRRRLLRFTVSTINSGWVDLTFSQPEDLPEFTTCHPQWHFQGYSRYTLYDANDRILLDSGKPTYCLADSGATYDAPYVECSSYYDCEYQGIQRGWRNDYESTLDCQWLDVTGIPDGVYKLEVYVNNNRRIVEFTTENNFDTALVKIEGSSVTVVDDWSAASSGAYCLVMFLAFCFSLLF